MKPKITSEYGKLRKVIVHTPGQEHNQLIPWEGDHPMMGPYPRSYTELRRNHSDLRRFLQSECGEENVWEVTDLLREVFEEADYRRRYQILQEILEENADHYVDHLMARGIKLEDREPAKLVRDLIHGYPRRLVLNNGQLPELIIPPKRELMWVRDSSAVTPAGVVINYMASKRRRGEPELMRAIFQHHPHFDADSIFLDLVAINRQVRDDVTSSGLHYDYLLEGGNILVLSESAIAVGVGRAEFLYSDRTTRKAFDLLVEKLFEGDKYPQLERVYLVNVPDLRGFIHLDTVFNQFAPQSAIAMPYIFGYPKPSIGGTDASTLLKRFVHWLRRNMGNLQTDLSKIPTEEHFEYAGRCEVYDRDYIKQQGRVVRLPQPAPYFFDQLVKDGYLDLNRVVWLGGDPSKYVNEYDHLRTALFEQHNMASNIFTTSPHRVVAYHRNPTTASTLRNRMEQVAGDEAIVHEMSSNEIRTDNGGPHCLTLPLERDS